MWDIKLPEEKGKKRLAAEGVSERNIIIKYHHHGCHTDVGISHNTAIFHCSQHPASIFNKEGTVMTA